MEWLPQWRDGTVASEHNWTRFGGTVRDAVLAVIGDHYGIYGQILDETTDLVVDLGSDGIDKLEVLMMMEELFGVRFDRMVGPSVRTIGDVLTLVENAFQSQ
jgi:acyl carrier protein